MRKGFGFRVAWLGIGAGIAAAMLAAMLAAVPAAAMVPPHIRERSDLRAIIDLPALASLFPINRIERVSVDTWRVTSGRCHIDVRMVAVRTARSGLTGPRYEPRAGRRMCGP